jgi:group I intron endonuclease
MNSGIYQILNTENGKFYIGSATDLFTRRACHWHYLKNGKHANSHLQNAWNKYGEDRFEFSILIYCDPEMLLIYEQLIINGLKPLYNICKVAGNTLGRRFSEETKKRMSISATGKHSGPKSEEHKQKLSKILTERNKSEKQKQAVSKSNKLISYETRKKLSDSAKFRWKETKRTGLHLIGNRG